MKWLASSPCGCSRNALPESPVNRALDTNMTQSIYLRLEVPFERGAETEGMAAGHADLQRLLAKSRLRVVSGKASNPLQQNAQAQFPCPAKVGEDDFSQPVKSLA